MKVGQTAVAVSGKTGSIRYVFGEPHRPARLPGPLLASVRRFCASLCAKPAGGRLSRLLQRDSSPRTACPVLASCLVCAERARACVLFLAGWLLFAGNATRILWHPESLPLRFYSVYEAKACGGANGMRSIQRRWQAGSRRSEGR